jgi:hypothetical protein
MDHIGTEGTRGKARSVELGDGAGDSLVKVADERIKLTTVDVF